MFAFQVLGFPIITLKYYNIPENPFKKSDVKYNDYETIKNKFHLDFLVYDLLISISLFLS